MTTAVLPPLPVGWSQSRLRFVATLNPSKTEIAHLDPETEVSFVPMEAVGEDASLDTSRTKSISEVAGGYTYFRDGDILIAKITPCFENGKATLARGLASGIGFGSTEFHVVRPSARLDARFAFYTISSSLFRDYGTASMYGAGGQKRVPTDFIADFPIPLPPLSEQRAIGDFLDIETAKIDALIRKQEELVERIEEKFQSVLEHTICVGLHGERNLAPTGTQAFGHIPSGWQLKPLMRLTPDDRPIMYGIVLPGPDVPDGIPIVKGGDVAPGKLRLDRLKRTTREIEAGYARSRLRGGDLVYAIRGSIGAVEMVPDELAGANLTQDAARVAPRIDVNGDWLLYALRSSSVFRQLDAGAVGATIRGINIRDLKRALIPVPPRSEQDEIATRLRHADEAAQQAVDLARKAIETLVEHRSALIAAAVSGQIDVRSVFSTPQTVPANDNRQAIRTAVGAEIVARHGASKAFGRVKLQKLLYLAEVHAGVRELAGAYTREAAGPLARDMLSKTEQGMAVAGYYRTVAPTKDGEGYTYSRIGEAGSHKDQFTALLGARAETLTKLIDLLKDYDTRSVEAIATLYAVWNDALLDGETPDDDRIVRGVLEEWHPEKPDKFTAADLMTWLAWMRRNGLLPTGSGPRTQIDRLFV